MHFKGKLHFVILPTSVPDAFNRIYKALAEHDFKGAILVPDDLVVPSTEAS
jgi:hypothetical protein